MIVRAMTQGDFLFPLLPELLAVGMGMAGCAVDYGAAIPSAFKIVAKL